MQRSFGLKLATLALTCVAAHTAIAQQDPKDIIAAQIRSQGYPCDNPKKRHARQRGLEALRRGLDPCLRQGQLPRDARFPIWRRRLRLLTKAAKTAPDRDSFHL